MTTTRGNIIRKVLIVFIGLTLLPYPIFIFQLQMIIGTIVQMAEDLFAAVPSFEKGPTEIIGDSFGPLVASKFSAGVASVDTTSVRETQVHNTIFEGRTLYIVRARGPGGTVGQPDEAVEKLMATKPKMVVMVDAALRLESETTGEIAEGTGAAIGGSGAEKWAIEDACAKSNVPLYAVVCKMSNREAISTMPKTVLDKVDAVKARVEYFFRTYSKPGDTVIIAGIGNTSGVN